MYSKIDALDRNKTWQIPILNPRKKALGCKWVYKIKHESDRSIERYKARLVVLKNTQVEGLDYNETFAPVVNMVTVCTFLSVAAARK